MFLPQLLGRSVVVLSFLLFFAQPSVEKSLNLRASSDGTFHQRDYFYVGQSYVPQGNSTVAFGQIYVEHLVPAKTSQPLPLLFIHGHGKLRFISLLDS